MKVAENEGHKIHAVAGVIGRGAKTNVSVCGRLLGPEWKTMKGIERCEFICWQDACKQCVGELKGAMVQPEDEGGEA